MSARRQLWSDLAEERSRCPVTRHEDVNAVRVTSYAGVKEMLRDFRSFSNRFGTVEPGQELPVENQVLAFADPPRHSRQRKLLTAALSASRVEHLHQAMQQTVDGLIDAIIATGSPDFELLSSLAGPFPALMTAELMGVPHELRERFVYYSHLSELSTAMPGVYDAELAQWSEMIEELVRQRRAVGPGASDDLIATMCFAETDGQRFSDREVAQMVQLVNSAGNTTTTTLISNIVYALDEFPEQKKLFLSDIDGLVDSVIEEGLRYDGPIQGLGRLSQCRAQIQGYDIAEGERVFGSYAAASHDPEVYEDADEFVAGRDWRKLPPHMGFGYGIHHCIGANLARLEARVALTTLYKRLPGLGVQPGFTPEAVPGWTFRGWMGMMLRYETKEQS